MMYAFKWIKFFLMTKLVQMYVRIC
jgi:hypothetical protein